MLPRSCLLTGRYYPYLGCGGAVPVASGPRGVLFNDIAPRYRIQQPGGEGWLKAISNKGTISHCAGRSMVIGNRRVCLTASASCAVVQYMPCPGVNDYIETSSYRIVLIKLVKYPEFRRNSKKLDEILRRSMLGSMYSAIRMKSG